ncbi:SRPBCC family protein [Dactylosporangium roseum]|uniref:SRPBCC family protein n=1 Tax=Dactylosporangium roseum TaxID=47989 RepID=A0ABY5ZFY8_9ACTN|nr:SRPBCC family protein [Dactylosporangium roseum]UWZ39868.1 SRPBCC family protein [Dactylosporangium roseum]
MPVDFRETVRIAAPAAVVNDVVQAVEAWPTWTASVSTVDRDGSGPLTVGEIVTVRQPKLPPSTWTVTKAGGTGFEWVSRSPGIRNVAGHWITDHDDGTCEVELTLSFAGPLARVTTLLYGGLIRRYVHLEAEGLRAASESR